MQFAIYAVRTRASDSGHGWTHQVKGQPKPRGVAASRSQVAKVTEVVFSEKHTARGDQHTRHLAPAPSTRSARPGSPGSASWSGRWTPAPIRGIRASGSRRETTVRERCSAKHEDGHVRARHGKNAKEPIKTSVCWAAQGSVAEQWKSISLNCVFSRRHHRTGYVCRCHKTHLKKYDELLSQHHLRNTCLEKFSDQAGTNDGKEMVATKGETQGRICSLGGPGQARHSRSRHL